MQPAVAGRDKQRPYENGQGSSGLQALLLGYTHFDPQNTPLKLNFKYYFGDKRFQNSLITRFDSRHAPPDNSGARAH